ncbi:alpha/beta hydrolase family protein [Phaeacidiphilus oryzae]|jgi:2,6-dihydroxypseudooxynicotine hydrolase|uniref:alpha/beta hydrolase family protein n=1 Tax=Phaeacidiphilus oryzae TaxID=348818 RepID=UPI00068AA62E|nr:alpha/beta fold hydrolase [Phaeacidiphilus oryzae]
MDDRVASALANWAPRFTTNGVTVSDFERVTRDLRNWSDWCAAWCEAAAEHERLGREALAAGHALTAGQHLSRAAVYYHFAKFLFVQDPDQLRAAHRRAVACRNDALPYLDPPGRRVEIPFEGGRMAGILRLPRGAGGEGPHHGAVLLLSGLDSAKEEQHLVEQAFLERGVATFSVDGPGQGEAEYDLPIRADWSAPGTAMLDALAAQPGVDPRRLAVWGVSLGGYYAPRVAAAAGRRIRACVALAGPFNLGECWEGLPPLTQDAFRVRSRSGSAKEARDLALGLDLAGHAERITAPLLVVFGRQDRLFPWQQAQRLADSAPHGELLMLERGNHGCANVAPWHRPYTADWVAERLNADG